MQTFTLRSYPKAILHVDGDNFFVSCELTKNPSLRGKPVVTGQERGIATAMSPEAKALGVTRGMPVAKIKNLFPSVIVIPSDYETYSLYARRMYEIVRRYTPEVEEYSIDECFADITGFRQYHGMSYEDIAKQVKKDLDTELGMTFSVGLGVNKVSAKIASNINKPNGFTAIRGYNQHLFLAKVPIEKVWMIGPNTAQFLKRFKIETALSFAQCPEEFVTTKLHKPQHEIWRELRAEFVYPLNTKVGHDYQSISKVYSFTPFTNSRSHLFSQLSKNLEGACLKLRAHHLMTRSVFFFLKSKDMRTKGVELKFSVPTNAPQEILKKISEHLDEIYDSRLLYRATGIVLMKLVPEESMQMDLFGKALEVKEISTVYKEIDKINQKFGRRSLYLGASMEAMRRGRNLNEEREFLGAISKNRDSMRRKRLEIIYLGKVR